MKVFTNNSKFFMEDNGVTTELIPNEDRYLKLPQNNCNRVWVSCRKVENAGGCIDYGNEVKQPRVLGPQEHTARKPIYEYLEGEDRETFLALLEKATAARKEATKKQPLTELEKAKRAYEKYQAAYEKALANAQNN